MNIIDTGFLISLAKNQNIKFVIASLSEATKQFLNREEVLDFIDYIVDNNSQLHKKNYNGIQIKSFEDLRKETNIILLGNHIESIIKQLKRQNIDNIFINIDFISKKALLPKNFRFEIEYPQKFENFDTMYVFSQNLIDTLRQYDRKIELLPARLKDEKWTKRDISKENNKLTFSYHLIGEKRDDIFRWKEGYLHKEMVIYDTGYSGWSSLADIDIVETLKTVDQKTASSFFDRFSKDYIENNHSKYLQETIDSTKLPDDFVFFPLQIPEDSVMVHSYFDLIDLLDKVVAILSKKNINIVIKEHPFNKNKELKELLLNYKDMDNVILYSGSIHEAISKCSVVYVINSGVGFEALLHLKPVVTFGKSDYMQFTRNVKDLKEIEKNPYYELSEDSIQDIKKFIYYYINNHSCKYDDNKKLEKLIEAFILKNNLNFIY